MIMQRIAEFTKTTLIGGVLVVLPVYVSALLLIKTLSGIVALLSPVTAQLPADAQFRRIIAFLIVVLVCFVAGLIVRTGTGLRAKNAFERMLLDKIPGYTLLRGLAGRLAGENKSEMFTVALAEIEEALVPAFIVEELDDGRYVIFVPSVPTPAAGAIYIIARERVHLVDVSFTKAVSVISKWGAGAGDLIKALRPA
jgi:uncharacterized membrane protein